MHIRYCGADINPVTPLELVDLCEADGFLFLRYRRKSGPAG
jgi:hypothetical protein